MSETPTTVAIALGSNLGDQFANLRSAVAAISAIDGVTMLAESLVEETDAFGPPQPKYLNQMVLVATDLSLLALLEQLQAIENAYGRERVQPKGPRTLDLDIVWAEDVIVTTGHLLVPHPGLTDREFWQRELAELLGVDGAADAIAAAQVHAGMDTAGIDGAPFERRPSGGWKPVV